MSYEIQSNLPIPGFGRRKKESEPLYKALEMLKVGDSFFVPISETHKPAPKCSFFGAKHNTTYVTRRLVENGIHGTRIWRTK